MLYGSFIKKCSSASSYIFYNNITVSGGKGVQSKKRYYQIESFRLELYMGIINWLNKYKVIYLCAESSLCYR